MTDVCLCEYTDHGHCGLVDEHGYLLNDETLDTLGRIAVSHAESGADVVYTSSGGKSVELELIDASGRSVRRQALGVPAAGRQQVRLDRGQGLAPGIYWLRLSRSGDRSRTTRLIFVG